MKLVFSSNEVSFDERIALELDALDNLDTAESPVAECQKISFQRPQLDDGDKEDDVQHVLFDRAADVEPAVECLEQQDVDCDEVRIMIKVLGPKVHMPIFLMFSHNMYIYLYILSLHK